MGCPSLFYFLSLCTHTHNLTIHSCFLAVHQHHTTLPPQATRCLRMDVWTHMREVLGEGRGGGRLR